MVLDILIMGSSRPQLIPYCVESIQRFVVDQSTNIKFRWFLHEDVIIPQKSIATIEYAHQTELFEEIVVTHPSQGLGLGMDRMFRNHITSKYILYVQEDFEFIRTGVDIDRIIWTMEKHGMNNIIFNKRVNGNVHIKTLKKEYNYNGLKLFINNAWHFIPGVWRMSAVRNKWQAVRARPEGYFINQWGTGEQRNDIEFCKNMGIYFYGGLNEYPYIIHNGNTWRMAEWRRDGNNPGGMLEWDVMHMAWFPPWINLEPRPTNKIIKFRDMKTVNTREFQKLLKKLSDEWREEIKRDA